MRVPGKRMLSVVSLSILISVQGNTQTVTNKKVLLQTRLAIKTTERENFKNLIKLSLQKGWAQKLRGQNGNIAYLTGVDAQGYPLYTTINNNVVSAATIGTNLLWPGGNGLNLTGSSANMNGKLGMWDLGQARATHVELNGRIVQNDPSSTEDHTTHVAGTLIGKGINSVAKGMAYGAAKLVCYDFNDHLSEMLTEADKNMLVSNHSYSNIAGWYFNNDAGHWEFWGQSGANEDYKFGYYSYDAQIWDSIAYMAPNYLIVKAAGNSRNENGPAIGLPYWRFDGSGSMVDAGLRPAGISSNNGYDNIVTYGTAKNILTIGAVYPIPAGYSGVQDIKATSFSSWGPTDDGRIKPDVVADGVAVTSSTAGADNAYSSLSGTSMASPAAAGSAFLLQEYYGKLHSGAFLRAASLKGLIIHTADEAGPADGPDYQYGWGLINMGKAAAVITAANNDHLILERSLQNTGDDATFTLDMLATGNGPVTATICWTDPKGRVESNATLNNITPKLINDLDLRMTSGTEEILPWILEPANPSAPATRGDNTRDNVEKITISNSSAGQQYTLKVTHKGSLDRNEQAFSVIVSGAKLSSEGNNDDLFLVTSPNPNKGVFNLQFLLKEQENVSVMLYNALGQQVYAKNYPGFSGQFTEQIYLPHLSKGLYLLKVLHGNKSKTKKIIVSKNN